MRTFAAFTVIDDLIKEFNKIKRHVYAYIGLMEENMVKGSLCSRMVTDEAPAGMYCNH